MTQELETKLNTNISRQELQAAKKTILSFISAFKAYTLYPVEHSFSRNNLSRFKKDIDGFLGEYGELQIDIGKNSFFCKDECIFEGEPEENNPAYLLTRDGLLYLEFLKNVSIAEISELLRILNQYRNPFDDLGGDIVTSLWQANFNNIVYEEVDIFALESFDFDLSSFKIGPEAASHDDIATAARSTVSGAPDSPSSPESGSDTADQQQDSSSDENGSSSDNSPPHGVLLAEQGITLLHVTPEEKYVLQTFINEEEQKDFTNDVIDILLILLIVQREKNNFDSVLEFLEFEFFETMAKGNFHLSYKICNNIQKIRNQVKTKRPWAVSLIDGFFAAISLEGNLGELPWTRDASLLNQQPEQLKYLWQVFRFLTPDIIFTLGQLIGMVPTEKIHIRNALLEIIESKAALSPEKMQKLMERSDENVNLLLSPVVEVLAKTEAAQIYLQMTHHDSAEIRKMGLDGYFSAERNPQLTELLHVLGDDNHFVRDRALSYLVQADTEVIELILCRYLSQGDTVYNDPKHVLFCYETLSRHSSDNSIPFLKKMLMEGKIKSMFSSLNAAHKKGAALTLKAIESDEAMRILQKGAQSMKPDIRTACQEALDSKQ